MFRQGIKHYPRGGFTIVYVPADPQDSAWKPLVGEVLGVTSHAIHPEVRSATELKELCCIYARGDYRNIGIGHLLANLNEQEEAGTPDSKVRGIIGQFV